MRQRAISAQHGDRSIDEECQQCAEHSNKGAKQREVHRKMIRVFRPFRVTPPVFASQPEQSRRVTAAISRDQMNEDGVFPSSFQAKIYPLIETRMPRESAVQRHEIIVEQRSSPNIAVRGTKHVPRPGDYTLDAQTPETSIPPPVTRRP